MLASLLNDVVLPADAVIGGKRNAALSGERLDNFSPRDGRILNRVAACDEADVDVAVAVARVAFSQGTWRNLAPRARKAAMLRLAEMMEAQAEELAVLETLDTGKPIAETRRFDIPAALTTLRYYAEAVDKIHGETGPSGPERISWAVRDPLGVIGVIVPWNFPLHLAMWKIAPALALGNSVVVKPSELAPLTALRLGEMAQEAGLPSGVLNVVPGTGPSAGSALARHMDVDMIAFTGSGRVGRQLLRDAADSNLKRVTLELGGKSPHIVMADWDDLDAAAEAVAWGICYNQGQVCTAGSRLLVQRSIHAEFLARLEGTMRAIVPGDPLAPETRLGAMISDTHLASVRARIGAAVAEGAQLVCGGEQTREETGGWYLTPALLDHVRNEMMVAQEEVFGPVLAVIPFDTPEDALKIANDSHYGLAAGLWTRDIDLAHRFARRVRAGLVWINGWDSCDITMPFGGFGQSGFGRDRSLHALEKYGDIKSISLTVRP